MRKSGPVKLLAVLLALTMGALLCACTVSPRTEGNIEGNAGTAAHAPESGDGAQGFLRVINGGEEFAPYEHFCWSCTYDPETEAVIEADGVSLFGEPGELILPAIIAEPDLTFSLADDCRITEIHVYDVTLAVSDADPDGGMMKPEEFIELAKSTKTELIADIVVMHTGEYVDQAQQNNNEAYGYAFRILPQTEPSDTEPSDTEPSFSSRFNEDGFLKLISGSEVILPLEHNAPGDELTSYSGLVTEGPSLNEFLPEIYEELPAVDRAKGFELEVYEWGSIYQIDVFNAGFDRIAHGLTEWDLYSFAAEHDEELIIDVRIFVPGDQIFEEPTERTGCGYAFIVKAEPSETEPSETEPSETEPSGEDALKLCWNGERVTPYTEIISRTYVQHNGDGTLSIVKACGGLHIDGFDEAFRLMPEVGPDFEIELGENCELVELIVYETDGTEIDTDGLSADEVLESLHNANRDLAVAMIVNHTGDYYEAVNTYEKETYGFSFRVKAGEAN